METVIKPLLEIPIQNVRFSKNIENSIISIPLSISGSVLTLRIYYVFHIERLPSKNVNRKICLNSWMLVYGLSSLVINTYLTPIHIFLLLVRLNWTKFMLIKSSLHIQNFICEANSFSLKLLLGIVFLVEVLWNRKRIFPRTIQLNGMRNIITLMSCQRHATHMPFLFKIYMECHAEARPCPPASRNRTYGCRTFKGILAGL